MVDLIVDTGSVPPRERLSMWAEASQRTFEPMDVHADARLPFSGRVWRHELGPLTVSRLCADASVVSRTPALIRRSDEERFELALQVRGRCLATQADRTAVLEPRMISSWHSSKPYRINAQTPFELLLVYVPNALLRPHTDRLIGRTAVAVPGDTGVGRVLTCALVAAVQQCQSESVRHASHEVVDSILTLVQALYADRSHAPATGPAAALRHTIQTYVEAHLSDPDLRPREIARVHHISRSYLDKLFRAEGMGVSEWVRTRRLSRIRRDLVDPSLAHETVACIAARWGLCNAAYLSRAFRTAYGESPRACRDRILRR